MGEYLVQSRKEFVMWRIPCLEDRDNNAEYALYLELLMHRGENIILDTFTLLL